MIYLLRHGETIWNRAGRAQGRGDSPLTWRGVGHAEAYGRWLARELEANGGDFELHSSPLFRTWQTASIVADHLAFEVDRLRTSPLLAELDCGQWEGLTAEEMERHDADRFAERRRDPWSGSPPGGESRSQVHQRALRWLESEPRGSVSVVVAHGIVSRVLRGAYLGLEPSEILELDSHHHGVLFRLFDGKVERIDTNGGASSRPGQS
ncbi:MAG: histidine phosphatase family protein [Myxococcota bacterium]